MFLCNLLTNPQLIRVPNALVTFVSLNALTSLGFQDRDLLLKYHEGGETAAYETEGLTKRVKQAEFSMVRISNNKRRC